MTFSGRTKKTDFRYFHFVFGLIWHSKYNFSFRLTFYLWKDSCFLSNLKAWDNLNFLCLIFRVFLAWQLGHKAWQFSKLLLELSPSMWSKSHTSDFSPQTLHRWFCIFNVLAFVDFEKLCLAFGFDKLFSSIRKPISARSI